MKSFVVVSLLGVALAVTACGSDSAVRGASSSVSSDSAPIETPLPTADPNDAACSTVQDIVTGEIKQAFNERDANNEFDKDFGEKLRTGAEKLYAVQRRAEGSVASAIGDLAKGLTDMSIAIDTEDDPALSEASTQVSSSINSIKGQCGL